MEIIKTDCALCVNSGCGINAYIEDGRLIKVEGMTEHPASRGILCPRAERLVEYVYSGDRLTHPMKRHNGGWTRISWDEALDTIAAKLTDIKVKHGAKSLSVYTGSVGVERFEASAFAQRFRGAFGTPNFVSVDSGCLVSEILGRRITFGAHMTPDVENAKCIILWANNPDSSMPPMAQLIRQALEKGSRLIVIDPRNIPLAKEGMHLQPRPGTDCALALGMLNVIISEELYDKEFVEKWTIGFDALKEHVRQYTPEKVEEITWVSASDIKRCARIYATNKPATIQQGYAGLERQINNVQNTRVLSILQTVTGNIDVRGGWVPFKQVLPIFIADLRIPVADEKPMGAKEYPVFYELWGKLASFGSSMLLPDMVLTEKPYPIKALIVSAGNPAVTLPDPKKCKQAFEKLDFMVVIDLFMTETAELADIVLPACTFLETTGLGGYTLELNYGIPFLILRKKVIEPLGESLPDWRIWSALGRRMGYDEYFPWETDEEMLAYLLEPTGISVQQLKQNPSGIITAPIVYGTYKEKGFATPSGKIEIFSNTLRKAGHDPLPVHVEPSQSPIGTPGLAKEYPLILITGARTLEYSHSQFRNLPELRQLVPEPLMDIHPTTAQKFGVVDGETVSVETVKGSIRIKANLTKDIAPQVVSIPHGWAETNVNDLTDIGTRDPIAGYPEDKGLLCKISKV